MEGWTPAFSAVSYLGLMGEKTPALQDMPTNLRRRLRKPTPAGDLVLQLYPVQSLSQSLPVIPRPSQRRGQCRAASSFSLRTAASMRDVNLMPAALALRSTKSPYPRPWRSTNLDGMKVREASSEGSQDHELCLTAPKLLPLVLAGLRLTFDPIVRSLAALPLNG